MRRFRFKSFFFTMLSLTVLIGTLVYGYYWVQGDDLIYKNNISEEENPNKVIQSNPETVENIIEGTGTIEEYKGQAQYTNKEPLVDKDQSAEAANLMKNRVQPSTKLIFKTYDKNKEKPIVVESSPDYNLIGLSREQVEKMYPDYSLQSFSSDMIVYTRTLSDDEIEGPQGEEYYIIAKGDKIYCYRIDGYQVKNTVDGAAFYTLDGKQINEDELLEMEHAFIESHFTEEEVERYRAGMVVDLNTYVQIMQNLTS